MGNGMLGSNLNRSLVPVVLYFWLGNWDTAERSKSMDDWGGERAHGRAHVLFVVGGPMAMVKYPCTPSVQILHVTEL